MIVLDLFERIVFAAKRLVLDYDLSDEEAKEISAATDKVNQIRGKYTDRKLETERIVRKGRTPHTHEDYIAPTHDYDEEAETDDIRIHE